MTTKQISDNVKRTIHGEHSYNKVAETPSERCACSLDTEYCLKVNGKILGISSKKSSRI